MTQIKELLDSNNLEDVILGLRFITKEQLLELFKPLEAKDPEHFSFRYTRSYITHNDYNIYTDIGSFWIHHIYISYTAHDVIGIFPGETTLNFRT